MTDELFSKLHFSLYVFSTKHFPTKQKTHSILMENAQLPVKAELLGYQHPSTQHTFGSDVFQIHFEINIHCYEKMKYK